MSRGFPPLPADAPNDRLELDLLERWKAEDLFHEVQRRTREGPEFVFFEGPPTANGKPGIHHVFARSVSSYGSDMSGKRGPSVSSFTPTRGLSPSRLMWSESSIRSPGRHRGCIPPHALETISVPAPRAFIT